jgi:predicted ATPase/transcriptional regulator with XRE-family HTH domain
MAAGTPGPGPQTQNASSMAGEVAGPAFGAILRRFRLDANLSQEQLAERARMSVDAISALERGTRRSPQRQTLALLVSALGIDGPARRDFEAAAARPAGPRLRAVDKPAAPAVKRNHNLPFALTSFIGRTHECVALADRLRGERLLTLAGTGGVGKTRLSVELGHAVIDRFADGVWLIELAEIRDPGLIVPAICAALGVREEPGVALFDTLLAAIATANYLLVIDNCEHLVASVSPLIEKLLARSPNLRIIATSREALRINGERIHRVEPLDIGGGADAEPAAVALFFDRARAVVEDLREDEATLAAVRTIVRRLDGLPLAIELAAARVDTVSVTTIADRLERRLSVLEGPSRPMLPHHVTLRSLVDWSHDQLESPEQTLFRRLGVFSGGCTLEAIETIAADAQLEHADILASMSALVDKSMIVAEPGRGRFRLLETMRQYAMEKLERSGEHARYVAKHAAYYLDFAARAGRVLRGPEQVEAMASLASELGNIRDALDSVGATTPGDERVLRALAAMMEYWYLTGSHEEGRARVAAIEALDLAASRELALVYVGAAQIATSESAFSDARRFTDVAATILAETPDPTLELVAAAIALFADVLAHVEIAPQRIATLRAAADEFGHPGVAENVATAQGFVALRSGDVAAATAYFEEALAAARAASDLLHIAGASLVFARLILIRTDPSRAARLLAEAVPALARRQHLTALASALEGLVVVAHATGEHAAAARFLGAARRMHRVSGASGISVSAPPISEDIIAELRAALGERAYAEFVGEGERAFAADVVEAVRAFSLAAGSTRCASNI